MRVSAKAEYACIAMFELAVNFREAQPTRVKAIAETHTIPQRFLVQILLQLKAAGLVASVRGAAGGYQLVRPPSKISMADIINAIDRTPAARPLPQGPQSPAFQALHLVWHEVQTEEQRMLQRLSLADLVARAQESNSLSYQI